MPMFAKKQQPGRGFHKAARGRPAEKAGPRAPDPGARWPKFALAPYVDKEGVPFYTRQTEEEKFLRPASIAGTRTAANSEWVLRMGTALSESAATAEAGSETLLKYFKDADVFAKHSPHLGFEPVAAALNTAEGVAFREACQHLNRSNEGEARTEDSAKAAIRNWLAFLSGKDAEKRHKAFRKLAMVSSRLYLFAMDALEAFALAGHPEAFAKAARAAEADNMPPAFAA